KYLLKTNFAFDVSVTELYGWFFGNGSLVILKPDGNKDILYTLKTIKQEKVTHINFVPSHFRIFSNVAIDEIEYISSLKYLFLAGEELRSNDVNSFLEKAENLTLHNLYGPTEATIYSTMLRDVSKGEKKISIGKPMGNYKAYIVDSSNEILPIGTPGELCISGIGLARGYLNKQELTTEKFIDNPYIQGEKMYKTGDLARWLPNGNIEFLGRIDSQVKIRGFRIELGEIENKLLEHESIDAAAVIVKEKEEEKFICAYISSK
ncbi:AMP-binding protein, partial [Bacillus pfraonensis]